ncbi:MAG: sugar ABC transporter permease [Anaerolineae bacterium]|nr:MAG: sugar ABC transporter permease [Anaerolineae bacterium]MCL4876123.1 sugar ABC transporter permease [Anaerolineae bacterium]
MIRTRNPIVPYLFVTPLIALLVFIFGYPLVKIFDFSFRRIRGITGPWVGRENYDLILDHPLFREAVNHNLQLLIAVPILIFLSLLIAVVLFDQVKGWRIYRTILFIPYILAVPIVAVVLKNFLQFNGPFNETLRSVELDALAVDWIGSPDYALWTVMGVIIWRELGFGIILMLSRLLSLDQETLEAAELDGAGWWQRFFYVILPQMTGVIEFYFVVSLITMIAAVFSYIYMIGRGGPGTSTMVLELYIYNFITRNSLPGIASAVSVMLFLVTTVLILILFWLRRGAREREVG